MSTCSLGQTRYITGIDSISIDKYMFFVKHSELYFNCQKEVGELDTAIIQLEYILIEKQDQIQMGEILINTQRNEIKKLQRQRTFLGIGVGVSVVVILLLSL